MCLDWEANQQPWCIGTTFLPTEYPPWLFLLFEKKPHIHFTLGPTNCMVNLAYESPIYLNQLDLIAYDLLTRVLTNLENVIWTCWGF